MRNTIAMVVGILLGTMTACSGGASSPIPYTTGMPFGGGDDEEDTEAATSIDLDGGEPLPPGQDTSDPAGGHHGDCCKGNGSPGCENTAVELCVCASDEFCCESEWDDACAELVEALGCGHCVPTDDGGTEPPPPPPEETTGGEPPPPEETTGAEPPPPEETTGGEPPPVGTGDCCVANGTPGCDDPTVQDCVCMADAYCCDTEWDGICVDEVGSLGCGSCGPGPGGEVSSVCCEQQPGAGCPEADVESCVCMVDDYCCNVLWDLTCAGEVESLGCGSCG